MARNYQKYCRLLILGTLWLVGCQSNSPQQPIISTPKPTVSPTPKSSEGTLERVKNRNKLICGVNGRLPGFSLVSDKGEWSGLDVDYCRAIAGAVLGDANAIELRPILPKDRFVVLQSGDVDVVLRNTPRTLTRDAQANIAFGPVVFFDGQGLMQRTALKPVASPSASATPTPGSSNNSPSNNSPSGTNPTATPSPSVTPAPNSSTSIPSNANTSVISTPSPSSTETKPSSVSMVNNAPANLEGSTNSLGEVFKDITDKRICVETGSSVTTIETAFANSLSNSRSESKTSEIPDRKLNLVVLPDLDSVITAYGKGECDFVSGSKSQLAAWRSKLPKPSDHKILDVSFDKEPFSPIVVGNDDRWRNVVSWVIYATFYAEELGINQKNYTTFKDSKNPDISRFLGTTDSLGIEIGLAPDWTTQILKAVGNYSDIYERNLGPLEIPRGLNRSWKQGGLLYAMPFR